MGVKTGQKHGRDHLPDGEDPIPGIRPSDYVLIEEIVADADAFLFEFTDIPQIYRHLKFECALSDSADTHPSFPSRALAYDLEVDWAAGGGDDYSYTFIRQWYAATAGVSAYPYVTLTEASDTSTLRADDVLPDKFSGKTRVGLMFRYYAVDDDQKFMRMEAEAWEENYEHLVFFHGAAGLGPDNGDGGLWLAPITAVTISSSNGLSEGSRISMYGIR